MHQTLPTAPRRRRAGHPNKVWSMDFVADVLFDGRPFRALTVVDNFTWYGSVGAGQTQPQVEAAI